MKPVEMRGHDRQINVVKFNFDGDLFFTGGADKKVCLYDALTQEKIGTYDTSASVKTIDIDINCKNLFVGNANGNFGVYEVQTGKQLGLVDRGIWKIKYLHVVKGDENVLVCYEKMGKDVECHVVIYSIKNLLEAFSKTPVTASKLDANRSYPVIDFDKGIKDIKIYKEFRLSEHFSKIEYGLLNKYILATSTDGYLVKFNPDGVEEKRVLVHDGECKGFNYAVDYSLVCTAGQDGVKLLDPETLEIVRVFKTEVPMNTVAISPLLSSQEDSSRMYHLIMAGGIPAREAAMSKKGGFEIHICNIMYEKEIGTLAGSFSPINSIEYSPDGKGFICGAEEGVCKYIKFDPKYFENYSQSAEQQKK